MPQTGTTTPPPGDVPTVNPSAPAQAAQAPHESEGSTETLIVAPTDDTPTRPFGFHASDDALTDLKRRITATKWPSEELDAAQGVQLATMQKLASYWATDYDWRKVESRLDALPQFVTNIGGVDIHFIHVRRSTRMLFR